MLRIQRAILLELIGAFLLTLGVVTAVLFAGQGLQKMGRTQGVELKYLLALLPQLLPIALAYSMPYSFLLAVAFTYGRMVSDRELVALRISGVHPRVVVAPALALGAVLALVSLGGYGWLLPGAAQRMRIAERDLVDIVVASLAGSDRTIAVRQGRISFGSYSNGTFHDFEMDRRTNDGTLVGKLIGAEAVLRRDGDELTLESPFAFFAREDSGGGAPAPVSAGMRRVNIGHVESLGATTEFNDFLGSHSFELKPRDMALPEVIYVLARGGVPQVSPVTAEVELHGRLAAAFATFVFGLVAAAVALQLPAKGRRLLGFFLSFLPVLLVHFPLALAGRQLADRGQVPPWLGAWAGDMVLLVVGGLLLRRAYVR